MYVCVYVCMCMYVCVYVHMYVCTYVCTYVCIVMLLCELDGYVISERAKRASSVTVHVPLKL